MREEKEEKMYDERGVASASVVQCSASMATNPRARDRIPA